MAVNGNGMSFPFMEFPLMISRQGPFPLDRYTVFYSMEDAKAYATSSPVAYVGQYIAVVTDGVAEAYQIGSESGELLPLQGGGGGVASLDIDTIVFLDMVEYEALDPPDPRTLYMIMG